MSLFVSVAKEIHATIDQWLASLQMLPHPRGRLEVRERRLSFSFKSTLICSKSVFSQAANPPTDKWNKPLTWDIKRNLNRISLSEADFKSFGVRRKQVSLVQLAYKLADTGIMTHNQPQEPEIPFEEIVNIGATFHQQPDVILKFKPRRQG